jgi:hypothetical protein
VQTAISEINLVEIEKEFTKTENESEKEEN